MGLDYFDAKPLSLGKGLNFCRGGRKASAVDLKRRRRGFTLGIILRFYRESFFVFPRFEFYKGHTYITHLYLSSSPFPLLFRFCYILRVFSRRISYLGIISGRKKKIYAAGYSALASTRLIDD